MSIDEHVVTCARAPVVFVGPVELRMLASSHRNEHPMSIGTGLLPPGAELSYHKHPVSEAVTVLQGEASVAVEGRTYRLGELDCMHVPAGTPHQTANVSNAEPLLLLWAFAAAMPSRELVTANFKVIDRGGGESRSGDPEHVQRCAGLPVFDPHDQTAFRNLFGIRAGCASICGRLARLASGTSTPCQSSLVDAAATVIKGRAICEMSGQQVTLDQFDTVLVSAGSPHCFKNMTASELIMIWVYGGGEPFVTIIDSELCSGSTRSSDNYQA